MGYEMLIKLKVTTYLTDWPTSTAFPGGQETQFYLWLSLTVGALGIGVSSEV